ncbi:hypothetical protein L6164_031648 [Bauhinia variegata]|uniref:Uncharacterized protein n=1 Tax=Bauhinia variegata TaxID=167791 RepID=A0ACB9LGL7_BAUVA|nr:hypothetical protein L6164_031648 [Bauhinia variegata]
MKQKVLIEVSMNDKKSRSKALKTAVGLSGVETAALKGQAKDQIEVTGEGIDAVQLTRMLRKRIGFSKLVSVGPVEQKKEEKKPEPPPPYLWPYGGPAYHPIYQSEAPNCSIM